LLPPAHLAAVPGLALYPDQPSLQETTDRRTDALSATRIERATYILQQPGDHVLPSIDIAWWDLGDQTIKHARTDAVTLQVTGTAPAAQDRQETAAPSHWRMLAGWLLAHWRVLILALVALGALAWLTPRAVHATQEWLHRRREAYARSEAAAF